MMIKAIEERSLVDIAPGSHVGWVVADPEGYQANALALLRRGFAAGEKTVVFGPHDGELLSILGEQAEMSADPMVEFLGGEFDSETMFTMFREQSDKARSEGFKGLRVVADMDWLLPAKLAYQDLVVFELTLDRVVKELGATVICAYRQTTFTPEAVDQTLSVHPIACGGIEPQFRFIAGEEQTWILAGEVDVAVASALDAAIGIAASDPNCVLDVGDLRFIDVSGMRLLAQACRANPSLRFKSVPPFLSRLWEITMLNDVGELKEVG